ncbi:MAG: hypothetical protein MK033_11865 [Candidatus Caenarcaniphilales bacterium]|nr:hypothetical protein [Candidatus Caenarcaniphilales bacterium]
MADIDNELNDLYKQLSSLSNGSSNRYESSGSAVSRISPNENLNKAFSSNKVEKVKSIFASEISNRNLKSKNVFDSANLKSPADKQDQLSEYLENLDEDEIRNIEDKVHDNLNKKENQNNNIFQKLNLNDEPNFEIIDNSEAAVTKLDRDELIYNKSLFVNQSKRKTGDAPADRDNSNYVNTSAKLLKDNNTFAPLHLKKYNTK